MTRYVTRNGRHRRPARRPILAALLVALALAVVAMPAAAGPAPAPPVTPPPAPPTTVAPAPPPPVTPPPTAKIASLESAARAADQTVLDATGRLDAARHEVASAQVALNEAEAATATLNVAAAQAAARYDASRAELQQVAVATYMQSGSLSDLDAFIGAGDLLEASRRQQLISEADADRVRVVDQALADRAAAKKAAAEADAERRRRRDRVRELTAEIVPAEQALSDAQAAAATAHLELTQWQSVALGTATPVLGVPAITGEQLAAWFRANHGASNTTVPIETLAAMFIQEGSDEGVRGDIAFAQSILETGAFSFPGGGLVAGTDNNFAGVGACDSCAHGHIYPDARTGVRVQIQYLHVYADRTMTVARFAHPPVDPNMDHNFRKGQAPTWAGLTHTWATADGYADSIFRIYYQILGWVTDHE